MALKVEVRSLDWSGDEPEDVGDRAVEVFPEEELEKFIRNLYKHYRSPYLRVTPAVEE